MIKTISILGTGWLGLPLAEHLALQGYQVKASARSEHNFNHMKAQAISPFVVDFDQDNYGSNSFWDSDLAIINIPCKNVTQFSQLANTLANSKIKKLIFVSSTSVYQGQHGTITEANTDYQSHSPLLEIEQLLCANQNFITTVIRFAGLIGYSRNPAGFFKNGKAVRDPEHRVNMIHRDDCINILDLLIKENVWGEIFNCCADSHPTKRQFYSYAAKVSGLTCPVFAEKNDIDNSAGEDRIIDNSKVKKALNYQFVHPDLMAIQF